MRKRVLLCVCAFAIATPALADQLDGKVGSIDRSGKTFTFGAQWLSATATYKTTPTTVFISGATPTTFDAVKIGHPVQVDYHVVGPDSIADRVIIK
ncbi:MAG: hypothetical protein JO001_14975 [Alphaproteobacteria bacterium]|nr:hypothetical protein [Alphaproteobacteria bacterium]